MPDLHRHRRRLARAAVVGVAALWIAGGAIAQVLAPDRDDVPLVDLLEVVVLRHQVIALDAEGGGQATARLRIVLVRWDT